jgi:hypothetical protein
MKKHAPVIIACCVVVPLGLLGGLLVSSLFGRSIGVVALFGILLIGAYSRRLSAAKKLEK